MPTRSSFLIIQTAFIGDVILATAVAEAIHKSQPDAPIDFLLRKGNEDLLKDHPFIRSVIIWDKKNGKLRKLVGVIRTIRSLRYDTVINIHRFASSGLITVFSGARRTIGFDKNPLSFLFSKSVKHDLASGLHEVQRNHALIAGLVNGEPARPRLYPSSKDRQAILQFWNEYNREISYVCIAPASVWFTKQFAREKWIDFIRIVRSRQVRVYLLGAPSDVSFCESIREETEHDVVNLSGRLSFLESTALMEHAVMNYVNDSAPLHLASSVNAPVTAIFCSTTPAFGFGPLSDKAFVVETQEELSCKPCGLHGYKACPQGHFKCALTITNEQLLESL